MGAFALVWCVGVALLYGRTPRLVRAYETILKATIELGSPGLPLRAPL